MSHRYHSRRQRSRSQQRRSRSRDYHKYKPEYSNRHPNHYRERDNNYYHHSNRDQRPEYRESYRAHRDSNRNKTRYDTNPRFKQQTSSHRKRYSSSDSSSSSSSSYSSSSRSQYSSRHKYRRSNRQKSRSNSRKKHNNKSYRHQSHHSPQKVNYDQYERIPSKYDHRHSSYITDNPFSTKKHLQIQIDISQKPLSNKKQKTVHQQVHTKQDDSRQRKHQSQKTKILEIESQRNRKPSRQIEVTLENPLKKTKQATYEGKQFGNQREKMQIRSIYNKESPENRQPLNRSNKNLSNVQSQKKSNQAFQTNYKQNSSSTIQFIRRQTQLEQFPTKIQKQKPSKVAELMNQAKDNLVIPVLKPNFLILDSFKSMNSLKVQTLQPSLLNILRREYHQNYSIQKEKAFDKEITIGQEIQSHWVTSTVPPSKLQRQLQAQLEMLSTNTMALSQIFRQMLLLQ